MKLDEYEMDLLRKQTQLDMLSLAEQTAMFRVRDEALFNRGCTCLECQWSEPTTEHDAMVCRYNSKNNVIRKDTPGTFLLYDQYVRKDHCCQHYEGE